MESQSLQVNAGFTRSELHLVLQGVEKLAAECAEHTTALSCMANSSMDDNTVNILDYYGKRLKSIHALKTRFLKLQEEMQRKQNFSVAHNLPS